jgi:hypothetical protein
MASQKLPVQPDLAVAEDTAKLQLQGFAGVGLGNDKVLAIPGRLIRQVTVVAGIGGIVGPFQST